MIIPNSSFNQGLQTLLDNQTKAKEHQELALVEIRAKKHRTFRVTNRKIVATLSVGYFLRNSPQQNQLAYVFSCGVSR